MSFEPQQVFKRLILPNGTIRLSFSLENVILAGTNRKWASPTTEGLPHAWKASAVRREQQLLHVGSNCVQQVCNRFKTMNQTNQKRSSLSKTQNNSTNRKLALAVKQDLTGFSGELVTVLCFSQQTYLFRIEHLWIPLDIDTGMPQAH